MGNVSDQVNDASASDKPLVTYYYVDEAGDPILFNRKKKVAVGNDGCSRFFILGKLAVANPDELAAAFRELRKELLADPYLAEFPSMQPERRKTARMFHAKDDLPEVRREVFKLLLGFDVRFFAVVRNKMEIVRKVQEHNKRNSV